MASKPRFSGERVRLGEICSLTMGQSPRSSDCNKEALGLPFFQGNADFGSTNPIPSVWCTTPRKIAHRGDILISVRAPIGAVNIADAECCIGRGVAAIRPDNRKVLADYLKHFLIAKRSRLERLGTGSTFKAIGKDILFSLPVPVPGLGTQEAIIRQLDGIMHQLNTQRDIPSLLNDLVKSRFIEMFEKEKWPMKRLDDLAEVQGGLTKNKKREQYALRLPYLRVANVLQGGLDLGEMLLIGVTETEKAKTLLQKNDLLFVEGNGSKDQIGRLAIWDGSIDPCVHQNHLIRARLSSEVLPIFALMYFSSADGRDQIVGRAVSTSGLFTLSTGKIRSLEIPLPPLPLQREFAGFAREVDKLEFAARRSIERLQMLYDSLAQEYFSIEEE